MTDFQISPLLLQELMVYPGQSECYEKGVKILEKTIGIAIGHSQAHWITDTCFGTAILKKNREGKNWSESQKELLVA